MNTLNEQQSIKLDEILNAFGDNDHLSRESILKIEPNERKANSLIDFLATNNYINRVGNVIDHSLPLLITLNSSSFIFMENGGFLEYYHKRLNEKKHTARASNIVINSSGSGYLINIGDNNSFNDTLNNFENDITSLKEELTRNFVSFEDIDELLQFLQNDQPQNKQFGVKVKSWIKKMMEKSIDGTWQVGISTAGGLLTELIKRYYGW